MSNSLKETNQGVENDSILGKVWRGIYIMSKAGLGTLIPVFLCMSGPAPLGSIVLKQFIENYRNAVEGVIKTRKEGEKNIQTSYICDNVLGILCNQMVTITSPDKTVTYRIGGENKVNFQRAEKFTLDNSNIPTEDEIRDFLNNLSNFKKDNPGIESLVIKGQSSPDGTTEGSLNGRDLESFLKNQELAKKRAEYIKGEVEKKFPELSGIVSVDSYVGILTEDKIERLRKISDKMGFSNGGLQSFIKSFNRGKLEGLSEDDLNFLNNVFDKTTMISIRSVSKKVTEGLGIEYVNGFDDIFIIALILPYIAGLFFAIKAYRKGLKEIDYLILNTQGKKREKLIDIYFGKELAARFREYTKKIEEIAEKMADNATVILYSKNGVECYRLGKDKFVFYSKSYPFLISSFEGGIDLEKIIIN